MYWYFVEETLGSIDKTNRNQTVAQLFISIILGFQSEWSTDWNKICGLNVSKCQVKNWAKCWNADIKRKCVQNEDSKVSTWSFFTLIKFYKQRNWNRRNQTLLMNSIFEHKSVAIEKNYGGRKNYEHSLISFIWFYDYFNEQPILLYENKQTLNNICSFHLTFIGRIWKKRTRLSRRNIFLFVFSMLFIRRSISFNKTTHPV